VAIAVYLYDSFTDRPYAGNVAGVAPRAEGLGAAAMRRVAPELGAPTTGFVVGREPGPVPAFDVRYFTPRREIALCGHVAVAVFTRLAEEGRCETAAGGAGAPEPDARRRVRVCRRPHPHAGH
jgi:PhzF family phenazine biosynthesis protein